MQTVTPENFFFNHQKLEELPNAVEIEEALRLFHSDSAALNNYSIVTRDNHAQEARVTAWEVVKNTPPVLISYIVGGLATLGYIGVAQRAAGDNILNYYLNPAGAIILNCIVNGYFFHLVVSPVWNSVFTRKPEEVKKALLELQDLQPGCIAQIGRLLKSLGLSALILAPALASAVPFYILDKEGGDSDLTATIVLLAATALQFKGVEAMLYKGVPLLFYPFQKIYRWKNAEAMKNHKIRRTIDQLKEAHVGALGAARQEILKLIQTKDTTALEEIYPLLMKNDITKKESIALLLKLLKLVNNDQFQSSPIGRKIVQSISIIITMASLPGYFIKTVEGTAEYAHLDEAYKEWLLGSAIFLISVALSLDVGWVVGGDVYDLASYTFNGIKNAWHSSSGLYDFAKKAWHNKGDSASWYNLFRLPLPVQQNPRLMLSFIGFLYALSYWSTQTSTYLNKETLGYEAGLFLELPTIISVMLFNSFPVDKVLGSAQRFLKRLFGSTKSLEEIKLEQFLQDQEQTASEVTGAQFLNILEDFISNPSLNNEEIEDYLQLFLGNQTAADVFGPGHKYSRREFTQIVPCLISKNIEVLSRVGFFSIGSQRQEKDPLIINLENGYGTHAIKLKAHSSNGGKSIYLSNAG